MKTLFLLMARYDARPFLSVDLIRQDFFEGMSRKVFLSKVESGEIRLPLIRLDEGQKAVKGVALQDLATFLDACSVTARKELERKRSSTPPTRPLPTLDTDIGFN